MNTDTEIMPPGVARIAGPVKSTEPKPETVATTKTIGEIQQEISNLEAETKRNKDILLSEQIAASNLVRPLHNLLEKHRLFTENTARGQVALAIQKNLSGEWRELLDKCLNHPHEVQTHLHNVGGANPRLREADYYVAEITRWLAARVPMLVDIEANIKACVNDGRKHLAHLLPAEIVHLGQ